jgi:hypothetical protein
VLSDQIECSETLTNETDVKCAIKYTQLVVENIHLDRLSEDDVDKTDKAYTLMQNATILVENDSDIAESLKDDDEFLTDLDKTDSTTNSVVGQVTITLYSLNSFMLLQWGRFNVLNKKIVHPYL